MCDLKANIITTLILGLLSLFTLFLMASALLNIHQMNAPDLSNEWDIVVFGLLIFLSFSASAILTSIRILWNYSKQTMK